MKIESCSFPGDFQIWTYDVSHGRLLLRRPKAGGPTRVDVLFTDVHFIQICAFFDSLSVETIKDISSLGLPISICKATADSTLKTFKIQSADWTGYVVAGAMHVHEDEEDFARPSKIFKPGPLMRSLAAAGYSP